jgi:hypothetical protein
MTAPQATQTALFSRPQIIRSLKYLAERRQRSPLRININKMANVKRVCILSIVIIIALSSGARGASSTLQQPLQASVASGSMMNVLSSAITIAPSQAELETGYVEKTGPSGIPIRISTNNKNGVTVKISCKDGSPQISLLDLFLQCTAPGSKMASWTPITDADQPLFSSSEKLKNYTIYAEVRIQNLWNYSGGQSYTNSLTLTMVDN